MIRNGISQNRSAKSGAKFSCVPSCLSPACADQPNQWEVVSFDMWSSLAFGRPPDFTSSQIDANLPTDLDRRVGEDGEIQLGCSCYWPVLSAPLTSNAVRQWNHHFTKNALLQVLDQAFGVTPLTYATVLRLDRLVRDHPLADQLRMVNIGQVDTNLEETHILRRNTIFSLTQKCPSCRYYCRRCMLMHSRSAALPAPQLLRAGVDGQPGRPAEEQVLAERTRVVPLCILHHSEHPRTLCVGSFEPALLALLEPVYIGLRELCAPCHVVTSAHTLSGRSRLHRHSQSR